MTIGIAEAKDDDAVSVAQLHILSWQASYAGILPDDYLQTRIVAERTGYWTKALPGGDYSLVLIARDKTGPVGFIAIKDRVDAGYDATIEHLHVLPGSKGTGLGRRLMREATASLIGRGLSSICLWVFEDNKPAIGFYESLGGVTDAHGTDKFLGSDTPDRRFGWRALADLQRACTRDEAP